MNALACPRYQSFFDPSGRGRVPHQLDATLLVVTNTTGGADFVHGSGKLTNTWDADVKDKPMFALHENRRLLAKQDKIVATFRATMCGLLDEITSSR